MKKENATQQVRVYPSTYKHLKKNAKKARVTLAQYIDGICN